MHLYSMQLDFSLSETKIIDASHEILGQLFYLALL